MIVHDAPAWVAQNIARAYARGCWFAFFMPTPNAFYRDDAHALLAAWRLYYRWAKWSGATADNAATPEL